MLIVTSENIANHRIVKTLGLVRGNTVRARHVGKDILASLRTIVGGEIHEYAKLMAESREQTLDRMAAETTELDEIRKTLVNQILQKKTEQRLQEWLEELHDEAYVEIKI